MRFTGYIDFLFLLGTMRRIFTHWPVKWGFLWNVVNLPIRFVRVRFTRTTLPDGTFEWHPYDPSKFTAKPPRP